MKRLEIIINQSIEEDFFDRLHEKELGSHYTKIPGALGKGNSDPKMGDSIWPEENVYLLFHCEESKAKDIEAIIKSLKEDFPSEGIKLFSMSY